MKRIHLLACFILVLCGSAWAVHAPDAHSWNADEESVLRSLWIGSLGEPPADPSNKYAKDPAAAALGKKIFFDPMFSANGKVSCSTCHRPDYVFTDDLPQAHGMGETQRRSMPLFNLAYQNWFFWDGRKDSLWSQALGPLESPVEHGITRTTCVALVDENYGDEYAAVFGPIPENLADRCPAGARPADDNPEANRLWNSMSPEDREAINRIYSNIGKAVGAYVGRLLTRPSRFDDYVGALIAGNVDAMRETLSDEEAMGLKLFIGKGKCTNCHNGALFANGTFHNVKVPPRPGHEPDVGRAGGIPQVQADIFNCTGKFSDAGKRDCAELRFMDTDTSKYNGAMKTPSLRNVADRPPYMDAGQFKTLKEVLVHYRDNSGEIKDLEHAELSDEELGYLEAFLKTLSSSIVELGMIQEAQSP